MTQGNDMRRFQWLAVTAAMTALAACSDRDDTNMTNTDVNVVDENLALPPADMNADMNVDMNAGMNADTNATDNAMNSTADNTTNAY